MSPQSMAGVRWNLTTHTASLQEPQAWLGPATMGMPMPPTCPTDALLAREVHSRGPAMGVVGAPSGLMGVTA